MAEQPTLARRIAHDVLVRVVRDAAYAERALSAALSRVELPSRDRALAHELVYGTLRHAPYLDFCLAAHAKKPLSKLPIPVWMALRLGAYQLLHTRVPPHSAVNESVALVASYGQMRGLVNALLRKLALAQAENHLPDPAAELADPIAALAILTSHPAWLLRRLAASRGLAVTRAWAEANNATPPLSLRVNRRRTDRDTLLQTLCAQGLEAAALAAFPDMLTLRHAGAVPDLPGFTAGHFVVQDPAAGLVAHLAAPKPGDLVLDACAAPGGKATHLAELMDDQGTVLAVDVHPGRVRLIAQNAERLGLKAIKPSALDSTDAAALARLLKGRAKAAVDVAVLDAPCSGMGTLRRNPELRGRLESSLPELCALQARLLDSVATVVGPGGVLIYAVCTVTDEEGPEQIAAFLRRHPDFGAETPPAMVQPFAQGTEVRTWTDLHDTDSFFAVRLRRHP